MRAAPDPVTRKPYAVYLIFLSGTVLGLLVTLALLVLLLANTAHWLVIDNKPIDSDIAVILGGGGGNRLRRAISIYNEGFVDALLLVGLKASNWDNITDRLCPDCELAGKNVTVINGSTTTVTDARLTLQYCRDHGIKKMLVITDPYHTRRTALIFLRVFRESGIVPQVVSSGDYGSRLSPDDTWWRDSETLETVWLELGKNIAILLHGNSEG